MANGLYAFGRESFLDGNLDWAAQAIKVVLVDEGVDVPNLATDQDLADRTAGARIATSGNLTTKTSTGGTADADNVTFSAVSGASVESFDIYYDSTVEATSILICNYDTATGLPVTPNGGDITITWDDGADKIFHVVSDARVLQERGRVVLLVDGRRVGDMPHQVARDLARALLSVAALADEWESAERIAQDQAVLMRAGAPIGLTNSRAIQDEAAKRAQWDSDLRRRIPSSISTGARFGTPEISIGPRKP